MEEITLERPKQELGKVIKSYHLFGDGWDEWLNTREEADKADKEGPSDDDSE